MSDYGHCIEQNEHLSGMCVTGEKAETAIKTASAAKIQGNVKIPNTKD